MATVTSSEPQTTTTEAAEPKKRSKGFLIVMILLVLGGAAFGITKYQHAKHYEDTDDAQVSANISPVIPRVSGYVSEVRVSDNQQVKKGDTLIVMDNRDLKIKLEQSEAALTTAQSNRSAARASTTASSANIGTSRAAVATIDAQIDQAKINVWRTTQDYNRYANLIKDHTITEQQFEQAQAAKETAEKQLVVMQQQRAQAATQINVTSSQSGATSKQINVADAVIKQRQADVDDAKLNLSYAVVLAPADGLVSKVNVQPGQYLTAGQSLFSIVLKQNLWVVANFKETQLAKMKVGQNVTINVDAFSHHDFAAKITSLSAATGASYALLPPDNASGNFVKVVQRVPVKIEFADPNDTLLQQLRAGMNVNAEVRLD
ncbi:MAG: HlyD family secretion protein [Bacteroidota bacterium]|nr:HlyD family secretion protein [Bacteroidota bacterium]